MATRKTEAQQETTNETAGSLGAFNAEEYDFKQTRKGAETDPLLVELASLLKASKEGERKVGIPWKNLKVVNRDAAVVLIRRIANNAGMGVVVRTPADEPDVVVFQARDKRGYTQSRTA